MAALVTITTFAGLAPPWSLAQLDTDLGNLQAAIQSQNTFSNFAVDSGAANAYVTTPAVGITATLTAGLMLQFKATNANTGASTLNHAGLGVKNILNADGSALGAGQIYGVVQVVYDGTQFVLMAPAMTTSAETAIPAGAGVTTIAHGLGVIPRAVFIVLRCKTGELGYTAGDEVAFWGGMLAGLGVDASVFMDATNVGIATNNSAYNIYRKDTGVGGAITAANWKFVARAWR